VTDTPPVCDYEGSNYQTEFWDTGQRDYEDRAERIALNAFLPTSGQRALEIGAGAGRLTPMLDVFNQVVLLDYSRTQLQQARTRLGNSPRYTYVAANVYQLPFAPSAFDGTTMIRVIHHLADAPAALKEIRSVIAPGGMFILEFANKQNWKAIFRYFLRQQTWSPFTPEPVEFVSLNFDFHPATIRKWLHEVGFHIESQRTVSHYRIGLLKRIFPASFLASLDAMAQPTGSFMQYTPSVFVKCHANGEPATGTQPSARQDVREVFRCPTCKGNLNGDGEVLSCETGHRWGVKDGVYDFKEPIS
jgi:ubiquinone/menaquinone biosynthesis C-methylase UbiE